MTGGGLNGTESSFPSSSNSGWIWDDCGGASPGAGIRALHPNPGIPKSRMWVHKYGSVRAGGNPGYSTPLQGVVRRGDGAVANSRYGVWKLLVELRRRSCGDCRVVRDRTVV